MQTLFNYYRYAGKDFCVWYDSLRPTHPNIHEEISKVLFNTAKFSYKSKRNFGEAKCFLVKKVHYGQVYVLIV